MILHYLSPKYRCDIEIPMSDKCLANGLPINMLDGATLRSGMPMRGYAVSRSQMIIEKIEKKK